MLLVIINHHAGNHKALNYWRQIENELKRIEKPYEAILSASKNETRRLIARRCQTKDISAVAVIGGDGTINCVLQELAHANIPLAIFPAGSGNDAARMFHLTNHPKQFVERLLTSEIRRIDLFETNGHYGLTVSGLGIDAMIGNVVDRAFYKKWFNRLRLNSISYLMGVLQAVTTFQPFEATVTVNGEIQKYTRTWLIACGNTQYYGGGLRICPDAQPDDGQLHMTIFHSSPKFQAFTQIFPALLKKRKIEHTSVSYDTATSIKIETNRPMQAIVDGEMISTTPIHIQLHPQALQLILTSK